MPRFERFDPSVHDPEQYIRQGSPEQSRTRKFLVLNSLMTKATVESLEVIRSMPEDERGKIILLGGNPSLERPRRYGHHSSPADRRIPGVGVTNDRGQIYIDKYYASYTTGINGITGFEVPVGEYGLRLAYATMQAARAVSALFEHVSHTHPQIMQAPDNYRSALAITFQGNIRGALVEGVQTIAGQFGLLTMAKVSGYENPMALYDAFRRDGTFNAWAAHAEFGRTAPQFSGSQVAAEQPVQIVEGVEGQKVKLTDTAKDNLRDDPNAEVDGCPVARRNTPIVRNGEREIVSDSGINLLADLFGLYLKYYYNVQEDDKDRQKINAQRFVPIIPL